VSGYDRPERVATRAQALKEARRLGQALSREGQRGNRSSARYLAARLERLSAYIAEQDSKGWTE